MKRSAAHYVTTIVAAYLVATIVVAFSVAQPTPDDWTAAIFFSIIGFFAILLSYQRSGGTTSGSVSFLPLLSGVVVSPTVAVCVMAVAAELTANVLQRKGLLKTLFNSAQFGLSTAVAVLILAPVGGLKEALGPSGGSSLAALDATYILGFSVASLSFMLLNALLVVGALAVAENRAFWITLRKIIAGTLAYDVLALPLILLLAWAYTNQGVLVVAIILPLLGLRQLYKQNAQLEKVAGELLQIMVTAMEARDPYTSGHSRRVAAYSRIIARSARLSTRAVERVGVAALLHDVGKIYDVYAPILRNPGRLTPEEFAIIQTHPVKSAEMVAKLSQLRDVVPAVRAHHERWDGRGYPDQLAGEQIPVGARVIALADTIDAMSTSRPYRGALSVETIRIEIKKGRGSQFDPMLVDALLTDVSWGKLDKAMRRFEGVIPSEILTEDDIDRLDAAQVPATARSA